MIKIFVHGANRDNAIQSLVNSIFLATVIVVSYAVAFICASSFLAVWHIRSGQVFRIHELGKPLLPHQRLAPRCTPRPVHFEFDYSSNKPTLVLG